MIHVGYKGDDFAERELAINAFFCIIATFIHTEIIKESQMVN